MYGSLHIVSLSIQVSGLQLNCTYIL